MAQGVVDVLEAVEVEEEEGHALSIAFRMLDGAVEALAEEGSVGEGGEGVVIGQAVEPLLGLLELGDVRGDPHVVPRRPIIVPDEVDREPGGENLAIPAPVPDLARPGAVRTELVPHAAEESPVLPVRLHDARIDAHELRGGVAALPAEGIVDHEDPAFEVGYDDGFARALHDRGHEPQVLIGLLEVARALLDAFLEAHLLGEELRVMRLDAGGHVLEAPREPADLVVPGEDAGGHRHPALGLETDDVLPDGRERSCDKAGEEDEDEGTEDHAKADDDEARDGHGPGHPGADLPRRLAADEEGGLPVEVADQGPGPDRPAIGGHEEKPAARGLERRGIDAGRHLLRMPQEGFHAGLSGQCRLEGLVHLLAEDEGPLEGPRTIAPQDGRRGDEVDATARQDEPASCLRGRAPEACGVLCRTGCEIRRPFGSLSGKAVIGERGFAFGVVTLAEKPQSVLPIDGDQGHVEDAEGLRVKVVRDEAGIPACRIAPGIVPLAPVAAGYGKVPRFLLDRRKHPV